MEFFQNNFYIVIGIAVLGLLVWYYTRSNILIIDTNGDLSAYGKTVNVASTKELTFKFKSTTYTGVNSINISVNQDMSNGAFCIIDKGFPNYSVTLQNTGPQAVLNTFNGSISADTVYYVKFPTAVTSFYLYTNGND